MVAAMHPQAKFDPIPPDLDLHSLVDQTQNFKWAQRVSREQIRSIGQEQFEKLVQAYVIDQGRPLVVEGWNTALPKPMFTSEWLEQTYDKKRKALILELRLVESRLTTSHRGKCSRYRSW
jgi:hypothetical protein